MVQPDGNEGIYNVLERVPFVCTLCIERGRYISRFTVPLSSQCISLEIPEGALEKGETPEDAARRELKEEIGKRPGSLEQIGFLYIGPGLTCQKMFVFVATELTDCEVRRESTEKIWK